MGDDDEPPPALPRRCKGTAGTSSQHATGLVASALRRRNLLIIAAADQVEFGVAFPQQDQSGAARIGGNRPILAQIEEVWR